MGAYALLAVLFLLSTQAAALTFPNPPDRDAPSNNQSGTAALANARSFSGGVVLAENGTTQQNVSGSEFVAEYLCIGHPVFLTKLYETAIEETVGGPLTAAQTSGVIQAFNAVLPPKAVNLTINVGAFDMAGNLTYVQTGMVYNVTTYSVWVPAGQNPAAEQRVGYITVSVPVKPHVVRYSYDMSGSSCNTYAMSTEGAGFEPKIGLSFGNPLGPFLTPPAGGLGPIFNYGIVKVLSRAGIAGAAEVRPGLNATFVLPPGSYSAVADITLFGIPFTVNAGKYSSPAGATTTDLTVSLAKLDGIWYGLELSALAVLLFVFWVLARLLRLREVLADATKRFVRAVHTGWRIFWD